jgi:predicted HAD superfamily hydrolase
MHVIFPDLSYNDALAETKLSKLDERWEKLSGDLFSNIVKNDNHKLVNLLPPGVNVSRNTRNPRTFEISRC